MWLAALARRVPGGVPEGLHSGRRCWCTTSARLTQPPFCPTPPRRAARAEREAADLSLRVQRLLKSGGAASELQAEADALRKLINCNVCHNRQVSLTGRGGCEGVWEGGGGRGIRGKGGWVCEGV